MFRALHKREKVAPAVQVLAHRGRLHGPELELSDLMISVNSVTLAGSSTPHRNRLDYL